MIYYTDADDFFPTIKKPLFYLLVSQSCQKKLNIGCLRISIMHTVRGLLTFGENFAVLGLPLLFTLTPLDVR